MFVRIYLGLVSTILVSLLLSYLVFSWINDVREEQYNESVYQGTFSLIRDGLLRHQGEKRNEWLDIVRRLSGITLTLNHGPSSTTSYFKATPSSETSRLIKQTKLSDSGRYIAHIPIDNDTVLAAEFENVSEQQLRVALLLALNELHSVKGSANLGTDTNLDHQSGLDKEVERLQSFFPFPLSTASLTNVNLDATQLRRLKSGAIIVVLATDRHNVESQHVYALIDRNKDTLLSLGPIPIYSATPTSLVIFLVFLNIFIVGVAAYTMVRRLEKRLNSMSELVNEFGPKNLTPRLAHQGKRDSVSTLAENFNAMAERIAELIQDQKHMSQSISHELRTPIARMKFRLDMLGDKFEPSDPRSHDSLEKINGLKRDLTELNNLVDEALFFQQVDSLANLVENSYETLHLKPCLEELGQTLQANSPDKHLVIDVNEDIPVNVHPNYFRRLLQNLILNGLRHANTTVKVSYESNADKHYLAIEDDGEGIEEALREVLFQPFQRAENSRNKKLGGYGLGLAIVRRIAELHRGTVIIETSSMEGARFLFSWPKAL